MKLDKDQKEDLKSLKNHPWFKVLELIEKQAKNDLWELLLKADLTKDDQLEVLKKNQLYMKAREDFLQNIDRHIQESYSPTFWFDK